MGMFKNNCYLSGRLNAAEYLCDTAPSLLVARTDGLNPATLNHCQTIGLTLLVGKNLSIDLRGLDLQII